MRLKWLPARLPWILVLALILYLTLDPQPLGDEELPLFPGFDKIAHFIMFGVLTGAYIYDRWRFNLATSMRRALIVATISAIIGIGVEILQTAMQLGRSGNDPLDAIANALGAFAAIPVCRRLGWMLSSSGVR